MSKRLIGIRILLSAAALTHLVSTFGQSLPSSVSTDLAVLFHNYTQTAQYRVSNAPLDIAKAQTNVAKSSFYPVLQGSVSNYPKYDVLTKNQFSARLSNTEQTSQSISLQMPILDLPKIYEYQAAKFAEDFASISGLQERNSLAIRLLQLYFDYARTGLNLEITKHAVATSELRLEDATARLRSGLVSEVDVSLAQNDLKANRNRLAEATTRREILEDSFIEYGVEHRRFIGEPSAHAALLTTIEARYPSHSEFWKGRTLEERVIRSQVNQATYSYKASLSQYAPKVNLQASKNWASNATESLLGSDTTTSAIGFVVSIPIGDYKRLAVASVESARLDYNLSLLDKALSDARLAYLSFIKDYGTVSRTISSLQLNLESKSNLLERAKSAKKARLISEIAYMDALRDYLDAKAQLYEKIHEGILIYYSSLSRYLDIGPSGQFAL